MSMYLRDEILSRSQTPQSEAIAGREAEQIQNNAGGFVFPVDEWVMLDRFLILGSEGGSYYATQQKLTRDNAKNVEKAILADGLRVVNRVVEISDSGRAAKNDPALFVLAMCASCQDVNVRRAALDALPKVARIGTHLFHFCAFVVGLRGYGRALVRALRKWYLDRPVERVALDVVKYRQRDGWSHRDVLRLAHPKTNDAARRAVIDWAVHGDAALETEAQPAVMRNAVALMKTDDAKLAADLVRLHNLPRECVQTELLNDPRVWGALLVDMPITAMIRGLGKMSQVGILQPLSDEARYVADVLANGETIRKARIHPISLLMALRTYAQGHGMRGNLTWTPVPTVIDALDSAFYMAFDNIVPTGKRILLALDVSGSMGMGQVAGTPLTPREAAAAMAMVIAKTEANWHIVGFTSGGGFISGGRGWGGTSITPLAITPRQRLDDIVEYTEGLPFGGTDCALPMIYAEQNKLEVDAVVVLTDSETWAGSIHPTQALANYRKHMGIQTKQVICGMVANQFSVADPADAGQMDVVGFDTAAPQVIADFIR